MAGHDSPELRTLDNCTTQLETALKGLDRELVHFLKQEGFFEDDVATKLQNPETLLTNQQKVWELVRWIKHRVKQHPPSYQVLLERLRHGGKHYAPIVGILEAEYSKQTDTSLTPPSKLCSCMEIQQLTLLRFLVGPTHNTGATGNTGECSRCILLIGIM